MSLLVHLLLLEFIGPESKYLRALSQGPIVFPLMMAIGTLPRLQLIFHALSIPFFYYFLSKSLHPVAHTSLLTTLTINCSLAPVQYVIVNQQKLVIALISRFTSLAVPYTLNSDLGSPTKYLTTERVAL